MITSVEMRLLIPFVMCVCALITYNLYNTTTRPIDVSTQEMYKITQKPEDIKFKAILVDEDTIEVVGLDSTQIIGNWGDTRYKKYANLPASIPGWNINMINTFGRHGIYITPEAEEALEEYLDIEITPRRR